jgi:hypothetical protein
MRTEVLKEVVELTQPHHQALPAAPASPSMQVAPRCRCQCRRAVQGGRQEGRQETRQGGPVAGGSGGMSLSPLRRQWERG